MFEVDLIGFHLLQKILHNFLVLDYLEFVTHYLSVLLVFHDYYIYLYLVENLEELKFNMIPMVKNTANLHGFNFHYIHHHLGVSFNIHGF